MVKVKYTCFAVPPKGISVAAEYDFSKDSGGYFVEVKGKKLYYGIEFMKMLFSPVDSDWKKLLNDLNDTVKVSAKDTSK